MKKIYGLLLLLPVLYTKAQIQENTIRQNVLSVAPQYGLTAADVEGYIVSDNYSRPGGDAHVYLLQTANGHEIFNAMLQLHFSAEGKPVYSNSRFVPAKNTKVNAATPGITAEEALKHAAKEIGINPETVRVAVETTPHPDRLLLKNESLFYRPVRSTLGYENMDGRLLLAYKLIVEPKNTNDMFNIRVDALTGKVLRINNRTLYCHAGETHAAHNAACMQPAAPFSPPHVMAGAVYNALPLGVESPLDGTRQMLTGVESPTASPFGWQDVNGSAGAEYTITRGNNVYAYEDQQDQDVPGYSPDAGASLSFNFPLDFTQAPVTNMDAALTNLFVWNNFMHDVTYFYGFDEVSGNFQDNNYNNGGADDDYVEAQGFDGSGTNNANFGTPEDGMNPRMQMYLWNHNNGEFLTVNSPASIAGPYTTGSAGFGPPIPTTPLTADIILVNDGSGTPTQGCSPTINAAVNGKIALVDRGGCTFVEKAQNVQAAGAVAMIVVNNQGGAAPTLGGDDFGTVTIPCISLTQTNGNQIKAQLAGNTVNGTIGGASAGETFDSNFDDGVISHEYGHGVSNRLTGGPSNVDCLENDEQAGEGWSDFFALVMTEPVGSTAANVRAIGNFVSGNPVTGQGIRVYPYSTNMTVNPLTYEDIDGLSIPHGVGTVWCTMLWDLYWNMVAEYGHSHDLYAQNGGNNKAIRLVVEGMRLQACSPGFVDARDAILQADQILYNGDNQCIIWKSFARRGLGFSATQGSSSNVGDENEAFNLPPACLANAGVEENATPNVSVYPNPATDVLYIVADNGQNITSVRITDISGKLISQQTVNTANYSLNTQTLAPGVYLLQVQIGQHSRVIRFVKR